MTTDKKNYTAKDALQLLKDLNLTQQVGAAHVLWHYPSIVLNKVILSDHWKHSLSVLVSTGPRGWSLVVMNCQGCRGHVSMIC